jgi:hypothetical protein
VVVIHRFDYTGKIERSFVGETCCSNLLASGAFSIFVNGLLKLTLELNFTNMRSLHVDPKSVKIQSSCQYLFELWGFTIVKVAHKMLMKLTAGVLELNTSNARSEVNLLLKKWPINYNFKYHKV